MPEVPECLNRRYKAIDDLINTLNARFENSVSRDGSCSHAVRNSDDIGIKLMCDFWNILKENPDCDLARIVKERMASDSRSSNLFRNYQCYMAETPKEASCCKITPRSEASEQESKKSVEDISLTKVLCNLKEAASTDRKCNVKIKELMDKEKELQEQVEMLEERELDAQELLQQADCMWSCMEETYKEKIVEKKEKLKKSEVELIQVENNVLKWRQRKKDLESQVESVDKYYKEITEKINNKLNDLQTVKGEITSFQDKIKAIKADIETVKKCIAYKKQVADKKMQQYQTEIKELEQTIEDEKFLKEKKEEEMTECTKQVREEYANISKTFMERKLENANLKSEEETLQIEYDMLMQSWDACKDRCNEKEQSIIDEIKKVDQEIAEYKLQCLRCHQNSSTTDVTRFCIDCPRCVQDRDCLLKGDTCERDVAKDCICMVIKKKFLNNIFENMYSVLETEVDTPSGKSVGSSILKSLQKSINGKIDPDTRKKLQKFVLEGVKRDIFMTIVGGAVKTRCEMDDKTYKQLMLCLKLIKPPPVPNQDKGTVKKDPCHRWPGGNECNCPKGPDKCICSNKAPEFPGCAPLANKENMAGRGPYKISSSCGPDAPMRATCPPGPEKAKPDPPKKGGRKAKECSCFSKNMRAAQCVLGPDSLDAVAPRTSKKKAWTPADCAAVPDMDEAIKEANKKLGACSKDRKCQYRDHIIEEVLGRHTEFQAAGNVSPYILSVITKTKDCFKSNNKTKSRYNLGLTKKVQFGKIFPSIKYLLTRRLKSSSIASNRWTKYNSNNFKTKPNKNTKCTKNTNDKADATKNVSTKNQLLESLYGGSSKPVHVDKRTLDQMHAVNDKSSQTKFHTNKCNSSFDGNSIIKIKMKSKDRQHSTTEKYYYVNDENIRKFKDFAINQTISEDNIIDQNMNISDMDREEILKAIQIFKDKNMGNTEYYKVKIEDIDKHFKGSHGLLKMTPSNNFWIILDKEYEKPLEAEMKRRVSGTPNNLVLKRSLSGNFVINLSKKSEENTCTDIKCGTLVQNESGKFKVVVNENKDEKVPTTSNAHMSNTTTSYDLACDKEKCVCRQLPSDHNKKSNSIVNYMESVPQLSKTDIKTLKSIWIKANYDPNRSEEESLCKNNIKLFSKKRKGQNKHHDYGRRKAHKNVSFGPNQNYRDSPYNRNYVACPFYENIVYHVGVDNSKFYEVNTMYEEQNLFKYTEAKNTSLKKNTPTHETYYYDPTIQRKVRNITEKAPKRPIVKKRDKKYVYHKNSIMYKDLVVYSSDTLCKPPQHKCTESMSSITNKCTFLVKNAKRRKSPRRPATPKRLGRYYPYKLDCVGNPNR